MRVAARITIVSLLGVPLGLVLAVEGGLNPLLGVALCVMGLALVTSVQTRQTLR